MNKALYYIKKFGYNALPNAYFRKKYQRLQQKRNQLDEEELTARLNYYVKTDNRHSLPESATRIRDFSYQKPSPYYFDLKEYLHYFKEEMKFAYFFGDDTHVNDFPTIMKARPIGKNNVNTVLFKLNKKRHYQWVNDGKSFSEKKNTLVWRGDAHQAVRKLLLETFQGAEGFDVGDTSNRPENAKWRKPYLSKGQQLESKFIFCPEGRDVATSLKWIFSSNSLCIMPEPTTESWFMEGLLQPGVHYAEVDSELSNLEEVMNYYSQNSPEAEEIIRNAQKHVQRFQNPLMENILSIEVLKKYGKITGQGNMLKFGL